MKLYLHDRFSKNITWGQTDRQTEGQTVREQRDMTKLIVAFRIVVNGSEHNLVNAVWGNNQCLL